MADADAPPEKTPLQLAVERALADAPKARDHYDRIIQERTGKTGKVIYDIQRGKSRNPGMETLRLIADVLGKPVTFFTGAPAPRLAEAGFDSDLPTVDIQWIDMAYGLGATFTDAPMEIQVLQFPKIWIEEITSSPPALLTWARGRGDSMAPTINDGDMVLLDRSQRRVIEQDALWAYTVGDLGAIKRLRVKGDRYVILSDNPAVPDDEEPIDFVNIVARVVFIGKRS